MSEIQIYLAVEDYLSEATARSILAQCQKNFSVLACYGREGIGYLKRQTPKFNQAAKFAPFFVLADLDTKPCPKAVIEDWLPYPKHNNLLFRIAVREIESWILADRKSAAKFLGISMANIPLNTDSLSDPKQYLLNLAEKSRLPIIRRGLLPPLNSTSLIGPGYNNLLSEFVQSAWQLEEGIKHSPSLKKACQRLTEFSPHFDFSP